MSQPRTRGGVPAFAGLRSFMSGGRRAEEDTPEKDKDEEARQARRAEEDKKREDEDARRAEEDDRRKDEDARRAEEDSDGTDDETKDGKRGKAKGKGKGEESDDEECAEEDDPDAKVAAAARAGRVAERARWINALNDPAAAPHAAAACVMLASTDMHSSAVIAAVATLPPPARAVSGRSRIDERMERVRTPIIPSDGGAPPDANSPEGKAAAIILAGKKRRGEA